MLSVYPSDRAAAGLILAHGAGGGQHSSFMVAAAHGLAARRVIVATFDFPYVTEGRSVPDRPPVLEGAWRQAISAARMNKTFGRLPIFIGGKSMGGRISSQVAAQGVDGISGLVYFGYPLHPPGRPQQRRDGHLADIKEPMLFVQGTRDQFGTSEEIRELLPRLSRGTQLVEVPDGDHSFKVRVKVTGRKQDGVYAEIFDAAAAFILAAAQS